MDFRLGKQIIRWGIVEGWRILDEVNPLDFKEHILRDVADRYIPLWMAKGDYYVGPLTIEGLWIPDIRGHEPAPLRSEWSQFQKLPDLQKVPRNIKNSEGGVRVSGMVKGYEFALAYFLTGMTSLPPSGLLQDLGLETSAYHLRWYFFRDTGGFNHMG